MAPFEAHSGCTFAAVAAVDTADQVLAVVVACAAAARIA